MVYGNSLHSSTLLQSQLLSVVILCSGNRSLLSPNAVLIEFKHKTPECFCINTIRNGLHFAQGPISLKPVSFGPKFLQLQAYYNLLFKQGNKMGVA